MQLVVLDPKFTSIMSKQRGEKGYRVLQGERLRKMLAELIVTEVRFSVNFKEFS